MDKKRLPKQSDRLPGIFLLTAIFLLFTACGSITVNFSAPLEGKFNTVRLPEKNFIVIGPVSAFSTEIHTVTPFGIVRKVEGSKITHNDLVIKAAELDADDIINVTIDIKTQGKTSIGSRRQGWERIFYYSGDALAIKYIEDMPKDEYAEEYDSIEILDS